MLFIVCSGFFSLLCLTHLNSNTICHPCFWRQNASFKKVCRFVVISKVVVWRSLSNNHSTLYFENTIQQLFYISENRHTFHGSLELSFIILITMLLSNGDTFIKTTTKIASVLHLMTHSNETLTRCLKAINVVGNWVYTQFFVFLFLLFTSSW